MSLRYFDMIASIVIFMMLLVCDVRRENGRPRPESNRSITMQSLASVRRCRPTRFLCRIHEPCPRCLHVHKTIHLHCAEYRMRGSIQLFVVRKAQTMHYAKTWRVVSISTPRRSFHRTMACQLVLQLFSLLFSVSSCAGQSISPWPLANPILSSFGQLKPVRFVSLKVLPVVRVAPWWDSCPFHPDLSMYWYCSDVHRSLPMSECHWHLCFEGCACISPSNKLYGFK
jgi:hypothetical protein